MMSINAYVMLLVTFMSASVLKATDDDQEQPHAGFKSIPCHVVFTGLDCKNDKELLSNHIKNVSIRFNDGRLRILPSSDQKLHIRVNGPDELLKNISFKNVLKRFTMKDKNPFQDDNSRSLCEIIIRTPPNIPLTIHANGGKTSINDWYGAVNIAAMNNAQILLTDIFDDVNLSATDHSTIHVDGLTGSAKIDSKQYAMIEINNAYRNFAKLRELPTNSYHSNYDPIVGLNCNLCDEASIICKNNYMNNLNLIATGNAKFTGECDSFNVSVTADDQTSVLITKRYFESSYQNVGVTTYKLSYVKIDANISDARFYAHQKSSINVGNVYSTYVSKKFDEAVIMVKNR